jgi:hypothetical protein
MNNSTREAVERSITHGYKVWRICRDYKVTAEEVRIVRKEMEYAKWRDLMGLGRATA